MMRKFYAFLILLSIAYSGSLFAQSGAGELRGKVQDAKTKEGIPFAVVIVESNGSQVAAQQSDFDGNFVIKPIPPGKYDVRVKIINYNERVVNGVIITSNKQTYLNPDMSSNARNLSEVTVSAYAKPLIEIDNTSAGGSLNAEEIVKLPTRNINSLVSTTAGVYQADEGAALSVKGSRTDANDYYIDGVKVRGTTNLPQGAIEQISVITGGIPAQYGDATGGIVTITTKGPSKKFNGGIEAATSEFLDGYGYNLVSGNLSGPLVVKNKGTESERSLIGFFASAELETKRDQNPSYVGAYKGKSDYTEYLKKNPAQYILQTQNDTDITGIKRVPTANFATNSNIDKVKNQDDNENRNLNFNLRLDYQPNLNNTFALGFSGTTQRQRVYNRSNMLFNSENNGLFTRTNYRVFGRYTQKFNQSSEESKSLLKNAYYTIQADFSRDYSVQEDVNHKDNFFKYGHVGKFTSSKADFVGSFDVNADQKVDTLLGSDGKLYTRSNYRFRSTGGKVDTAYAFSANGSSNPDIAVYNTNLLDYIDQQQAGGDISAFNYRNFSGFQALTGILNGGGPQSIYGGLFNSPGTISNLYDVNNRDQYRVTAMASADLKGHAIQVGIEYEQRIESRYRLGPRGLWSLMRQQQNSYLRLDETGIDITGKTIDVSSGNVTLLSDTSFVLSTQNAYNSSTTEFAKNIRTKLGKGAGEFIDVDSYDPSTFSVSMFDASNLINNLNPSGLSYTYFGYTYDGKKSNQNVTMEDFLKNPLTRPVGAFRPIYTAGYIQDKFTFKDIVFNLGVRIDRFDANQQVLKDKFSLYELRSAGELASRPANIPASAAVYVDDNNSSSPTVRGYRVDDVFYDASGNIVQDYAEVRSASSGRPTPWIAGSAISASGKDSLTVGAFKDYEPQTQIMPRIAFSFPISDEASFFANYDVLTQRPRSNVYANPITYYLQSLGKQGQVIVSPDLKPEKTINYQFGFKQRLGQTSAITMTAFYKELKDNFQQVQIATAYPTAYLTYANRDFGTIKGFTLQYDLRRTNNISLNAAYTLQFANGTGSNTNSAANLISSGESEPIRIALPLDYDQRHTIVTTIDYRYGEGASYTGPAALKSVLENFGINFIFRAGSGTPYSRIAQDKVQDILSADDTRFRRLIGEINGSRLPWQYNMDIRVDKDFNLTSKSTDGKGRNTSLNVYLLVQNLFDTRRVASVYPATGLPDDDGYLTSPQASDYLSSIGNEGTIQSYIDLYKIAVNDPGNFRLPRVVRVGAIYNF